MNAPDRIFDLACRLVRRHDALRPVEDWLRRARLFVFDLAPHELPVRLPNHAWLNDNFVLPFDVVAIEDRATCTFLTPVRGWPAFGTPQDLGFLDVIRFSPDRADAFNRDLCDNDLSKLSPNECSTVFVEGVARLRMIERDRIGLHWPAVTMITAVFDADGSCHRMPESQLQKISDPDDPLGIGAHVARNVSAAIHEACYLCDPASFLLEEAPLSWVRQEQKHGGYRRAMRQGRIRQSFERPVYRVLRPKHARERMGVEPPVESDQHGVRRPHERRGHWRMLRAERFRHKRGQRVWVRSCWIGPSQRVIGNRRYRVLLDIAGETGRGHSRTGAVDPQGSPGRGDERHSHGVGHHAARGADSDDARTTRRIRGRS